MFGFFITLFWHASLANLCFFLIYHFTYLALPFKISYSSTYSNWNMTLYLLRFLLFLILLPLLFHRLKMRNCFWFFSFFKFTEFTREIFSWIVLSTDFASSLITIHILLSCANLNSPIRSIHWICPSSFGPLLFYFKLFVPFSSVLLIELVIFPHYSYILVSFVPIIFHHLLSLKLSISKASFRSLRFCTSSEIFYLWFII